MIEEEIKALKKIITQKRYEIAALQEELDKLYDKLREQTAQKYGRTDYYTIGD
jgi:uncharacterized coiled-coil protein SlyX